MTHVVHLAKFYPPDSGGIESVTEALARGAARDDFDVSVVCFGANREDRIADDGVVVRRHRELARPASQPLGATYIADALRLGRAADIVHVHAPNMVAAMVTGLLGEGPRVIVHWHSDVVGKGMLGYALRPVERGMIARADRIICTSEAYAGASPALNRVVEKTRVIPIGVPEPGVVPAKLSDTVGAWLGHRQLVLAVGRLVPYKGFKVLVDATRSLPESSAVIVVGGGPERAALSSRIAALGLEGRVLLAGRVDEFELEALYRRATLFCLPSIERSEAFGVVLAEAMARSLPLVSTRIAGSGVPWVNEDGVSGLHANVGDADALAASIKRILRDDDLRVSLAGGARQRYLDHFTSERAISSTISLYNDVARDPGRRGRH